MKQNILKTVLLASTLSTLLLNNIVIPETRSGNTASAEQGAYENTSFSGNDIAPLADDRDVYVKTS